MAKVTVTNKSTGERKTITVGAPGTVSRPSSGGSSSGGSSGGSSSGGSSGSSMKYYVNPQTGAKTYRVGGAAAPQGYKEISSSDYNSKTTTQPSSLPAKQQPSTLPASKGFVDLYKSREQEINAIRQQEYMNSLPKEARMIQQGLPTSGVESAKYLYRTGYAPVYGSSLLQRQTVGTQETATNIAGVQFKREAELSKQTIYSVEKDQDNNVKSLNTRSTILEDGRVKRSITFGGLSNPNMFLGNTERTVIEGKTVSQSSSGDRLKVVGSQFINEYKEAFGKDKKEFTGGSGETTERMLVAPFQEFQTARRNVLDVTLGDVRSPGVLTKGIKNESFRKFTTGAGLGFGYVSTFYADIPTLGEPIKYGVAALAANPVKAVKSAAVATGAAVVAGAAFASEEPAFSLGIATGAVAALKPQRWSKKTTIKYEEPQATMQFKRTPKPYGDAIIKVNLEPKITKGGVSRITEKGLFEYNLPSGRRVVQATWTKSKPYVFEYGFASETIRPTVEVVKPFYAPSLRSNPIIATQSMGYPVGNYAATQLSYTRSVGLLGYAARYKKVFNDGIYSVIDTRSGQTIIEYGTPTKVKPSKPRYRYVEKPYTTADGQVLIQKQKVVLQEQETLLQQPIIAKKTAQKTKTRQRQSQIQAQKQAVGLDQVLTSKLDLSQISASVQTPFTSLASLYSLESLQKQKQQQRQQQKSIVGLKQFQKTTQLQIQKSKQLQKQKQDQLLVLDQVQLQKQIQKQEDEQIKLFKPLTYQDQIYKQETKLKFPPIYPMLPLGGGLGRKPSSKKGTKRSFRYTPSLVAQTFNIYAPKGYSEFLKGNQIFTGGEIRPLFRQKKKKTRRGNSIW